MRPTTPVPPVWRCAARLAGVRVLLIENCADTARALSLLLRLEQATVTVAADGVRGLNCLQEGQFDVVLSDLGMPEMHGFEFARAVRVQPHFAELPLVALSGFADEADVVLAMESGFTLHMAKPLDLDQLVRQICELPSVTKQLGQCSRSNRSPP